MSVFTAYAALSDVLDWLQRADRSQPPEPVALAEAAGRVLAADVLAVRDFPPFDRARADGYALRALDTAGAGGYGPVSLALVGEVGAACAEPPALAPGAAVRVAAGAPLPAGADAVAPLAYADEQGGQVEVAEPVAPGENLARRGEECRAGEILLATGRRLQPADLALLAAAGPDRVQVWPRPRVRILIAGAGLATENLSTPNTVPEAVAAMLAALAGRDGGLAATGRQVARHTATLAAALSERGADLILVAGASGEGADDVAAAALHEAGELAFHGIALEPARSAGVGRVGPATVLLLPGDPYAAQAAYEVLAAPLLRRLAGFPKPTARRVTLAPKLVSGLGAMEFRPLRLTPAGAVPLPAGLAALAAADGFLLVPEDCEGYPAGAEVEIVLYPS